MKETREYVPVLVEIPGVSETVPDQYRSISEIIRGVTNVPMRNALYDSDEDGSEPSDDFENPLLDEDFNEMDAINYAAREEQRLKAASSVKPKDDAPEVRAKSDETERPKESDVKE